MERPKISARMSTLTLGTGKITRFDDTENLELHMNPRDYSSLVTQRTRPHDVFSVIQIDRKKKTDSAATGKGVAVVLPKTYITRSGSLFLYSDSKIMRDNQDSVQTDQDKSKTLSVQGKAVPKEIKSSESYPTWGRLLTHRPMSSPYSTWGKKGKPSKKERINYMKDGGKQSKRISYSWNYAVTPLKLINISNTKDLATVHGLSEAILTYNQDLPTGSDKYANVMHQAWGAGPKPGPESPRGSAKLSNWTRSWLTDDRIISRNTSDTIKSYDIKKDRNLVALVQARSKLSRLSTSVGRAPANTPMSYTQGTSRKVRDKVQRRAQSSITTTNTNLTNRKSPISHKSYSEDEEK